MISATSHSEHVVKTCMVQLVIAHTNYNKIPQARDFLHVENCLVKETHCCPFVIEPDTSVISLVHVPLESISSGQAPSPARHWKCSRLNVH